MRYQEGGFAQVFCTFSLGVAGCLGYMGAGEDSKNFENVSKRIVLTFPKKASQVAFDPKIAKTKQPPEITKDQLTNPRKQSGALIELVTRRGDAAHHNCRER